MEEIVQAAAGARPPSHKGSAATSKPAAPDPKSDLIAPFRSPAAAARLKRRHVLLILSFVISVIMPLFVSGGYLFGVADDQYASHVGFSVRKEETSSAIELLGGITELSGSSSSDTDILYEFIQSQQMVRIINEKVDLAAAYSIQGDPVFSLGSDHRIEALSRYWRRMVTVFYDNASGLIEVRVLAFSPEDAQTIARLLFDESSQMINELSAIARADATRYAREELERSQTRLKQARQKLTAFRTRTQIVDPSADIQGQIGLLTSLQAQLAEEIIERELLKEVAADSDPRVQQIEKKIEVIREQIDKERARFGSGDGDYSRLLEEYEALAIDQEFGEKSYLSAQAAYDAAVAEAQRKSRYLASHIEPTLAETPEYPRRWVLLLMIGVFLAIGWAICAMIYYSLRDRH